MMQSPVLSPNVNHPVSILSSSSSVVWDRCCPPSPVVRRRLLIIDTDVGSDDAIALLLALRDSNTTVLAVTTIFGNVSLSQATQNAHLLLAALDSTSASSHSIPVYVGAATPMINIDHNIVTWPGHGKNGLGDADFGDEQNAKMDKRKAAVKDARELSAAEAINHFARKYPGQVDLVALGVTHTIKQKLTEKTHTHTGQNNIESSIPIPFSPFHPIDTT